ncbi:MAG: hypothetical protein HYZ49_03365 [Chloroflexi bacterium]|nr:hypothetical protein [Chloroflexota bacterium]
MSTTGPVDFLLQILLGVLADSPKEIIDWYKRKLKGITFAVFGYRGTGKTTLLRRMQGITIHEEVEPTFGRQQVSDFDFEIYGGKEVTVKKTFDPSGEKGSWPLWRQIFLDVKPQGIIFVIDHERPDDHRIALRRILNIIRPSNPRRPSLFKANPYVAASNNLKAFLLLVNKSDMWESQSPGGTKLQDVLKLYSAEILEIEKFMLDKGGQFYAERCSAKYGNHFDEAIPNFLMGMIHGRRTRKGKA